ncbi:MAG TPA: hypothetical protein VEY91_11340 [Candidatus Limnocylindria bacterium]|nr:hypothetical protein [Candidatus Limnocylindria bacterium]
MFVSRQPLHEPGAVPGIGPHHRAAAPGGQLLVRERNGRIRELLRPGTFFDASDPSVSWDGKRIVFAATRGPGQPWRIWIVDENGSELRPLSADESSASAGAPNQPAADDLDPCWLPDGRVAFASTRFGQVAMIGGAPATNLFAAAPGGTPTRISSERNGADEPSVDPLTGRIVYARWWFNRYFATEVDSSGLTTLPARAVPMDTLNLWHAITITPSGDGGKLAGGNPRVRAQTAAYEPVLLNDGTLVGVAAERAALSPAPGRLTLWSFRGGFAEAKLVAGGENGGSACAPAALPDGRVLFSYDPDGRGDYGLYVARTDGSGLARALDLPGTLELDAAVLEPTRRPPVIEVDLPDFPRHLPLTKAIELKDEINQFRFDCLNVYQSGPVDSPFPDAPPFQRNVRIRFYATLSRPEATGGDTVVLLRESKVTDVGAVHEHELPADTPMFEQLVDSQGHVLRSSHGPAHVSGLNSGRFATGTKCVGCHLGHSALAVPHNYHTGARFNAAPSARVEASSVGAGTVGARAVVDRRARGPADRVAWVAAGAERESVRLSWQWPIAVDSLVLYSPYPDRAGGTDLRVRKCQVVLVRSGREVGRRVLQGPLSPAGTRFSCDGVVVDAIEISPLELQGRVLHRRVAALAEIEALARLTRD